MPVTFGLDLGNTNCCLAYYQTDDSKSSLVAIQDDPGKPTQLRNVLRSAVLFPLNATSEIIVGRKAVSASPDSGLRFINFKSDLMHGATRTLSQRGVSKTPQDALIELLRSLKTNAAHSSELGHLFEMMDGPDSQIRPIEPPYINLCAPTQSNLLYFRHLLQALVASGWYVNTATAEEHCTFLPEPVAVLLNHSNKAQQNYLVFDYGGLTLDMALAQVQPDSPIHYNVLKTLRVQTVIKGRSYDVGGSFIDRLLLGRLLDTMPGGLEALVGVAKDAYPTLNFDPNELLSLIRMDCQPESLLEADEVVRMYQNLLLDVETTRIGLSENMTTPWRLNTSSQLGAVSSGVTATTTMLEDVLSTTLNAIHDAIAEMMAEANIKIDRYILAGGCSQTPRIIDDLKRKYGVNRVYLPTDFSPLETIAAGAARAATGQGGRVFEGITDTDYGVWTGDESDGKFSIIIPRGTAYSETRLPPHSIPEPGKGKSRKYQSQRGEDTIKFILGQRSPNTADGDKWQKIGELDVPYDRNKGEFSLYFEIDARHQLRIKVLETALNRLVNLPIDYVSLIAE